MRENRQNWEDSARVKRYYTMTCGDLHRFFAFGQDALGYAEMAWLAECLLRSPRSVLCTFGFVLETLGFPVEVRANAKPQSILHRDDYGLRLA